MELRAGKDRKEERVKKERGILWAVTEGGGRREEESNRSESEDQRKRKVSEWC